MEKTIQFRIQSLLTLKEGRVSGPMSPMLFAEEMTRSLGLKFDRLARLWFADECINQRREDGGLTGFDTLLIGTKYENDLLVTLWVDLGAGGVPVAMGYLSDKEGLLTEAYKMESFARKLTPTDAQQIFDRVLADVKLLDIKEDGV